MLMLLRMSYSVKSHVALTAQDQYRVHYFQVLDGATMGMSERFSAPGYMLMQNMEHVIIGGFKGEIDNTVITNVGKSFTDIDASKLKCELRLLHNLPNSSMVGNMTDALSLLKSCGAITQLIPEIIKLTKLYFTLPSSTATAERSFSTLRRIKTYLRSTMSQKRLNHVLVLTTYKERLDTLQYDNLLTSFITANELRRSNFSLP